MEHYANECPTILRGQKLNFNTTLSDESESKYDEDENVIFLAKIEENVDHKVNTDMEDNFEDDHFSITSSNILSRKNVTNQYELIELENITSNLVHDDMS